MKKFNLQLYSVTLFFSAAAILNSCAPKEPVVFKGIKNITVDLSDSGKPALKADAFFYNPNKLKMKLREVDIDVFVDGAKSAEVKHKLDVTVAGQSDFSVPITAQLSLNGGGLLNTVLGFLGGKEYEVSFTGSIRIAVHGVNIKVPVAQKQQIKMR